MRQGLFLVTKRLGGISGTVFKWCSEISSVLIIVLMFLVTADVVGRYVFKAPIPGVFEVSEVLLVVIVFLAYAHTEAIGQNIRIRIIENRLTARQRNFLDVFTCLVGIFIYGIIAWKAWGQAWSAFAINECLTGGLRLPLAPAKFVLVLGSFMLVIQFVVSMASSIGKILKG